MTGAMVGTLHYMSPEQILGEGARADARTDVYAMGVMLYELVRGERPFGGSTAIEIMAGIMSDTPPDPCAGVKGAPPGLSAVIRMAMARDPEERYPTALAFGQDLAAAGSASGHVRALSADRVRTRRRRGVQLLVLAGVLVLGTLLAVVGARWARPLSAAEFDKGLSQVDQQARDVLAGPKSRLLAGDGERVSAAAARLDALLVRRPEGTDERVAGVIERTHATKGLYAMASGREAEAAEILKTLSGEELATQVLRAALEADDTNVDPTQVAETLTRALERGIDRPELHAWRLRARARAGVSRDQAQEVLSDVSLIRRARGGALLEGERLALAWARLALGSLKEVEAQVADLGAGAPAALRWELTLARCLEDLEAKPADVLARLKEVEGAEAMAPSARARALGDKNEALLEGLVRVDRGRTAAELEALIVLLGIAQQLRTAAPLSAARIAQLKLGLTMHKVLDPTLRPEVGRALSDALPEALEVQTLVSGYLFDTNGPIGKGRLLIALRRRVRLETSPAKAFAARVELARQLGWLSLPPIRVALRRDEHVTECLALTRELLAGSPSPAQRGAIQLARAQALYVRARFEEAARAADEALELVEPNERFTVSYVRLLAGHALGTEPEKTFAAAVRYAETGTKGGWALRSMVVAWALRAHGDRSQLARAIRLTIEGRASLPGWSVRLASLQLAEGDVRAAGQSLERASRFATRQADAKGGRVSDLKDRIDAARASLDAGDTEQAAARVEDLVTELEKRRTASSLPGREGNRP